MSKKPPKVSPTPVPRTIVYQNADFVSAMLQEMYQVGLLQSSESDATGKKATTENKQKKATAGATAEGTAPLLAKAAGKLDGEWVRQQTEADERSSAQRQKFVYSQAHYLDAVRRGLAERGQLSTDAFAASAGDIVEFTALTVRPNEVNALLDEEHRRTTVLTDYDTSLAGEVFDAGRDEATCPACGCRFPTSSSACPDCGLSFA